LLKKTKGYLMIATAGALWGTVGFLVTKLLDAKLPLSTIIFYRMFLAFFLLFFFILFTDSSKLKIDRVLLKYVIAIGLISQCLFNICYFSAIKLTSIATAVTLLYTAPIFIAIMARVFFHEFFTKNKVLALLLCVFGCFLAVTGGNWKNIEFSSIGILLGIASGITYGSLTIFSKPIAHKYHSHTIVFYSLGFGVLFYLPFAQPMVLWQSTVNALTWFYILSLSIISTIIPLLFYCAGLSMGVEASQAGIISTVEVVVSVIVSLFFFQELLWGWKLMGILMVIGSVVLVRLDKLIRINGKDRLNNESV